MFERMTTRLFKLCEKVWSLARSIFDPVIWHKRDFKLIADFLVNFTMDCKQDW